MKEINNPEELKKTMMGALHPLETCIQPYQNAVQKLTYYRWYSDEKPMNYKVNQVSSDQKLASLKFRSQQSTITNSIEYFMWTLNKIRQNGVLEKNVPPIPHPPLKGIVLQGGGVKGMAYLGALEEMEKTGALEEAEFVCGSSAGAINALLIATGLSADQIKQYCIGFDTRNLMDARESYFGEYHAGGIVSIMKEVVHMMSAYGEAKTAKAFLRNILLHLTGDADITFAELEKMRTLNPSIKEFLCIATLLPEKGMGSGHSKLFSNRTSPNVVVADAVLASMNLPGVWSPVNIRQKVYRANDHISFETIGTYLDGGIHNNLPVDVVNEFVNDNEYLMIPRNGKYAFVLDNPCVLSFSFCKADQLNEAVCPIPIEVKALAIRNDQNNERFFHINNVIKAQQELEEYQPLSILCIVNPNTQQSISVHKEAERSDLRRLISIVVDSYVEDMNEKNMLHNEGSILLYDNDISAAELGISEKKKNELMTIGSKTTKMYFLDRRNPTKEYSHPELYILENFDQLDNDRKRNEKLDDLFMVLVKEFEKYNQLGGISRDYMWEKMEDNIKIQHLYWKINKIYYMLTTKHADFDDFVLNKLNDAFIKKNQKENLRAQLNDNLYIKLCDLNEIKNDLKALIKQKPFDKQYFFTRFSALGADTIVQLANKHRILLLSAALLNPQALEIMLTLIEKSYISFHQIPKIAAGVLGKPRMKYQETKRAYRHLINLPFRNKPLIFHCIDANQPESLKSLLQHHVNQHVLYEGKSIVQYAVEAGKIECYLKGAVTQDEYRYQERKPQINQYSPKNFGKFMTGFHNKRRSLEKLMKFENKIVWDTFKKVITPTIQFRFQSVYRFRDFSFLNLNFYKHFK